MSENKTLRVAMNHVEIEGLLVEKNVKEDSLPDGREFIDVTLTIQTSETDQHSVKFFSLKNYERDGKLEEIWTYKGLKTVADEFKTVADVGREEADYVSIKKPQNEKYKNGHLGLNEYYNDMGLMSFPEISAQTVNRVEKSKVTPKAKFNIEAVVEAVIPEEKDEEETGRAILRTYIPVDIRGTAGIIPFDFIVHEDGAGYVLDNYSKGQTVEIYGDIVNQRQVEKVTTEAAFGQDKVEEKVTYVREYIVMGGTEPFEEDDPKHYSSKSISDALVQREVNLEEMENKFKSRGSNSGGNSGAKPAFDVGAGKDKVQDDDLPF